MGKAFISFNDDTITGKVFGDLTVSYSKDIDNGALSTTGCVLTELGLGEYILENPNITTKRAIMRCKLTSDATKKFRAAFDPADGDVAQNSTVAKEVTLSEIKGTGFDTNTESLKQIKAVL